MVEDQSFATSGEFPGSEDPGLDPQWSTRVGSVAWVDRGSMPERASNSERRRAWSGSRRPGLGAHESRSSTLALALRKEHRNPAPLPRTRWTTLSPSSLGEP